MPPKSLIRPGYIHQNDLALWFGPSGGMKSFLVMDVAHALACRDDWHGNELIQCLVIVIAGEGQGGIDLRNQGLAIHHDVSLDKKPLYISDGPAAFYDEINAQTVSNAIHELMEKHPGLPLVIFVDTVARSFGPGNESFTSDMGVFISNLDKYLRQRLGATVVLIHHSGIIDKDRARGSSALHAAVDKEFKITRDQTTGVVSMECTKNKEAAELEPLSFSPKIIELPQVDEYGEPFSTVVLELTDYTPKPKTYGLGKNQQKAIRKLKELYDNARRNLADSNLAPSSASVTVDIWRAELIESEIIKDRQGFYKIKTGLMNRSVISINDDVVKLEGEL